MKPPWLEIAQQEIGQDEQGIGDNPRILEYHNTTTLGARTDEVPWCSSFVNWCMVKAGYEGTNNALAKSWLNWGVPIFVPIEGCVCVIKHKTDGQDKATGSSSGYHVAFWLGQDGRTVKLLGGNQSNRVKISDFMLKSYEIMGFRIPSSYERSALDVAIGRE